VGVAFTTSSALLFLITDFPSFSDSADKVLALTNRTDRAASQCKILADSLSQVEL
jgi:hypothetical protein